ncbi:MAG: hypothetical protein GY778_11975 [bacterium]|nr:hypothetical protein [bacterium]
MRSAADWNDDARNPYYVAKTRSEREAVRLSEALDVPTIRICPAVALGPYDYRITPSTRTALDLINGATPTYEGGSNFVDVRDVAEVHAAAVEMGEPGGRYLVCGENLHQRELAQLIQSIAGVTPRHVGLTGPIAYLVAAFVELGSGLRDVEPPFTRSVVHDVIGRYAYYACTPTYETVGLAPRSTEEMVGECIRWLLFVKKIDPVVAERLSALLPPDPEWEK